MTDDRIALLKEEYFHLQKTVDDFDQRILTIKAWSVTTSMAGIATSFLHDKIAILCLLLSLASLSFWAYHDLSRVYAILQNLLNATAKFDGDRRTQQTSVLVAPIQRNTL